MPNADVADVEDILLSVSKVAMKTYRTYDGSNRLEYQYECPVTTINGGKCIKTQYSYVGATTQVEKSKETVDAWSSAYDI